MADSPSLKSLDLGALTAAEGARRVALRYLAHAREAYARLDEPGDREALHDLRVAIRRLRSTVEAYWPHLEDTVGRGDRRRLVRLARATNPTRDLEVLVDWLRAQLPALEPAERAGAEELLRTLAADHEAGVLALRDEPLAGFQRAADRLEARLSRYQVNLDGTGPSAMLATSAADQAGALAADLRQHLGAATSLAAGRLLHRARIRAKRLRYLLEPWRNALAGAADLLDRLRSLQDLLGDLHDALVFTERILPRLHAADQARLRRALGARLWAHRTQLFARLQDQWLGGRAEPFFAAVERVRGLLLAAARPLREIERKYLLRGLPPLPRGASVCEIDQGYVPGRTLRERVRRVLDDQGERWYRTVKLGRGVSRMELEEETTADVFEALWGLTQGCRVRKLRYRVADGGVVWEIDRFTDRELVLAEVELPAEDTEVVTPAWLGPYIVREVTDEPAYVNVNLAK